MERERERSRETETERETERRTERKTERETEREKENGEIRYDGEEYGFDVLGFTVSTAREFLLTLIGQILPGPHRALKHKDGLYTRMDRLLGWVGY